MQQQDMFTPTPEYLVAMKKDTDKAIADGHDHAKVEWRNYALQCVEAIAKRRQEFTVNDVREMIHNGPYKTHDNRAVGGVVKRAQRYGMIRPSGRTIPNRVGHGTQMQIWSSCIYQQAND